MTTPYGTCPVCKRTQYTRITCCQEKLLEPLVVALNQLQAIIFQNVACDGESEAQIRAICDAALAPYREKQP